MPDGSGYVKLLDFAGAANGSRPFGSLISEGSVLYGMTSQGGSNNIGTLFKIMSDGSGYVKLLDFVGVTNGSTPNGSLISDGTYLYGTTQLGGSSGDGTIFKIMFDGSGYVKLLDFAGTTNGGHPSESLTFDGTFLYGMTHDGGTGSSCILSACGTIFKIMPDGSGYVKLFDFENASDGKWPNGSFISAGTTLFGMTTYGGTNDLGTLFKIESDGSAYLKLLDFDSANGSNPYGSLIANGSILYGMTNDGGANDLGTIFKFDYSMIGIEENTGESNLNIYPNPTNGKLNIACKNEQKDVKLEILNMVGQSILSVRSINLQPGENYVIDISSMENGVYILRFNGYQKIVLKN